MASRAKERFTVRRFIHVYHLHMPQDPRRERLFLASLSFLVTFASIRALTFSIRNNIGPFHNMSVGGTHLHHLVWGILLLLVVGYVSLFEFGTRGPVSNAATRITALAFGVGAALTLDEFALWLNLKDVYWERQGRQSIDAVAIFAALLLVGALGRTLLWALAWEVRAMVRGAGWAEREALLEYRRLRREEGGSEGGSEDGSDGGEGPPQPVDRAP